MSSTPTKILFEAYQQIQAGQLSKARGMLRKLLRQHPNSERGWLLMSMAVLDAPRQRECLRHVLQINPFNTEAQARLAGLSTDQGEGTAAAESVIADEPSDTPQPIGEVSDDVAVSEVAPVEEYGSAESALPMALEAGATEPPSLDAELQVAAPPTRPSVTSILVPPEPVTFSSSPVITFEPDRPAPSTEPPTGVAASEPALDAAVMKVESESVVDMPAAMAVEPEPEPVAEITPEPPASIAESTEPETTDTRSHRRASRARKRRRAERSTSEHRIRPSEAAPPAEEPPAKPPNAPLIPAAAPSLEPVVNWQRMYEQPAASTSAPVAVDQSPIHPPRPAPPQRELPPPPQRDYYEEQPWPRFMLPAALLIWAVIVIGIFFVIARLLMG
ncbi:MAG: hypothetical protein ACT4QE_04300 [Anaerolineales bacterium]